MKKILTLGLLACISIQGYCGEFSGRLDKKDVEKVCDAVASWQIDNFAPDENAKEKHTRNWTNGVLYKGMVDYGLTQGKHDCVEFVSKIGESNRWTPGTRVYHADDICVGQAYLSLYKAMGDDVVLQGILERAYYIVNHPSTAPLSKNDAIGKDTRWSWCDALFMAAPVFAELYSITGEQCYADFLESEFRECTDSLYDHDAGLYYRDCKRIPLREPNGAKQFWGRGNGWVYAALALVLEALPQDYPTRSYYSDLYMQMTESLIAAQDSKGAWHASLLDPESYPAPENSAAGLICYGLAWGLNNGYLAGDRYETALKKGWKSLVKGVAQDGKLGYVQPIGSAPQSVDKNSTDVYGVGAFLLAGNEILKML